MKAHFSLESALRARAWLNAIPSESSGNKVQGILFCYMLKRRLRQPVFGDAFYCPLCDDVMDVYGDHALVCIGGGDRISRHNSIRNRVFQFCQSAGLRPQLEKGALPKLATLMKDYALRTFIFLALRSDSKLH